MNQTSMSGAITGLIIVALLLSSSLVFADGTLWYQGLFDGEVKVPDQLWGWYEYSPTGTSAHPLYTRRHSLARHRYGRRYGLWTCPVIYLPTPEATDKDSEDKDEQKKVHTPRPLPGQYWYERPSYSGFRTPITVGWPYQKYDKR